MASEWPDTRPTMAHLLDTFAYHVSCIAKDGPFRADLDSIRFQCGLGYGDVGCAMFGFDREIRLHRDGSASIDGCRTSREHVRALYTEAVAPVFERLAALDRAANAA